MTQNKEQTNAYKKLCTEFYDITKPKAGPREVRFYEFFLKKSQGPILEAMCGSGRLLLPLLRLGYSIDGVDNSAEMLESCSTRCKGEGLQVDLFNQPLQGLSLPKKYGLIFIAAGSFQLFEDRTEALKVLKGLHQQLLPGGTLLLDTFIPWGAIRESIEGDMLSHEKRMITSIKRITTSDGSKLTLTSTTVVDPKEQLEICNSRYEKTHNSQLVATEDELLSVRWYHRYEMELFLEKAGFTVTRIWDTANELDAQATVYQAMKRE